MTKNVFLRESQRARLAEVCGSPRRGFAATTGRQKSSHARKNHRVAMQSVVANRRRKSSSRSVITDRCRESGGRLARLDLQAWTDVAARGACSVRTLGSAAVWAKRRVRSLDRLVRTTTTGTTWGAAEWRNHDCLLAISRHCRVAGPSIGRA